MTSLYAEIKNTYGSTHSGLVLPLASPLNLSLLLPLTDIPVTATEIGILSTGGVLRAVTRMLLAPPEQEQL